MNHQPRLITTATALVATLLLVTGCGAQRTETTATHPAAEAQASTPCLVSADRVDHYRQAHLRLPGCIRARQAHHGVTEPEPCLIVADRIEQWIALGLELPSCVRRLQHL